MGGRKSAHRKNESGGMYMQALILELIFVLLKQLYRLVPRKVLHGFYKEQAEVAISPDATSKIYFLPTHSLELVEAAALKEATAKKFIESREPRILCFDVLIQYLKHTCHLRWI